MREVIGRVDDRDRALLDVEVRSEPGGADRALTVWIDMAFDGHLVFSTSVVEQLNLQALADTEAILADGTKVTLETFLCYVQWFGTVIPLQVIANDGKLPLLGTGLLQGHVLHIDYAKHQLTLE